MSTGIFVTAIIAAVVSLFSPLVLRPLLLRLGTFDVPNHRSSHTKPTLRGGGIAPLAGIIVGGTCLSLLIPGVGGWPFNTILFISILMAIVGLIEDIKGVPIVYRAGLQLGLGGIAGAVAVAISGELWAWALFVALAFAYHVNATNFMDGINGISALHGGVVGANFIVLGLLNSMTWMTGAGLLLSLSFLAFLPWNLLPPGMFLGDVGSYLLGGCSAAMMIIALAVGIHPLAVIGPVCIYWIDTFTTLVRRLLNHEPVFQAHRTHIYQRLTNLDLTHMQVSSVVTAFSIMAALAGLAIELDWINSVSGLIALLLIMVGYMITPRFFKASANSAQGYAMPTQDSPTQNEAIPDWNPTSWVVIGGSGFIGSALVDHLQKLGQEVRVVTAPRLGLSAVERTPDAIVKLSFSTDIDRLVGQLQGAEVVVNAAGVAAPVGGADDSMYGANSLLPSVISLAAERAGVSRFIHLSSAAVQGARDVLDTSTDVSPFSPYSHSKALGERALLKLRESLHVNDLIIARATSVQGTNRQTTIMLKRIARSKLSSVASPGTQPTVVSSVYGLCEFIFAAGRYTEPLNVIQIQPWEGLSVYDVLELAGHKPPMVLPKSLCRALLGVGKILGSAVPRVAGVTRRVELMWFGQEQETAALGNSNQYLSTQIEAILSKETKKK